MRGSVDDAKPKQKQRLQTTKTDQVRKDTSFHHTCLISLQGEIIESQHKIIPYEFNTTFYKYLFMSPV